MKNKIIIAVINKLILGKRAISVYHHYTRSAHMISHGSAYKFAVQLSDEADYLHISLISGPGNLENNCVVDLPAWADYEFFAIEKIKICHSGKRTRLRIPAGISTWQLRIIRPTDVPRKETADQIIIGDE